jgi:cell division protein FtsB
MKLINKFFLGILLLILFSSFIKNFINYQEGKKFYDQYKKNYEEEKKKNTKLKTQMIKQTNIYEVEKKIRNELNLLQPDEVAVILPPIKTTPTPTPTPNLPNWKKWINLYQGKEEINLL